MRETESTPNEKFLMEENEALRTKIKEMSLMLGFKKIEYSPVTPPPFPNQDEGHVA